MKIETYNTIKKMDTWRKTEASIMLKVLLTKTAKIFVEIRVADVDHIVALYFGLAVGDQRGDGKAHGDAVV